MKTASFSLSAIALLSLVCTLTSSSASAAEALHESPGRRACRLSEGTLWDVQFPGDQIELCRFNGLGIEVNTFAELRFGRSSMAVSAFLKQSEPGSWDSGMACQNAGGSFIPATDLDGAPTALCQFQDGSMIEALAFSVGSSSSSAAALAQALRN